MGKQLKRLKGNAARASVLLTPRAQELMREIEANANVPVYWPKVFSQSIETVLTTWVAANKDKGLK